MQHHISSHGTEKVPGKTEEAERLQLEKDAAEGVSPPPPKKKRKEGLELLFELSGQKIFKPNKTLHIIVQFAATKVLW